MSPEQVGALAWEKQGGLLPAVVQDARTLQVLMVGYMDRAALQATLDDGLVTFHSRSRGRQWRKGGTSGNTLAVARVEVDCDGDTLLVLAHPAGPTCHRGDASCFGDAPADALRALDANIARRSKERPAGSYTTRLFQAGVGAIAQKVGEEGVETALAAVIQDDAALSAEAADLLYHLLVLLHARGMSLHDATAVLAQRSRVGGLRHGPGNAAPLP